MVVGTVGRFWQARATHAEIRDGDAFIAFDARAGARAVMNFSFPKGARTDPPPTETRIALTDAGAAALRRLWLIVRPGAA